MADVTKMQIYPQKGNTDSLNKRRAKKLSDIYCTHILHLPP